MKPGGLVPRGLLVRKPPHGSPCNGCGACCMVTRCPLGQHVFGLGEIGPCPALVETGDNTYGCGLVLRPAAYVPARALSKGVGALRRAALLLIGSGDGCDARFNGEWRNVPYADALDARWLRSDRVKESKRAKRLWGARA